ncbi:MAG: cellulose biosynthesis cyclic di-GMP-binding regulatory protein BcsB, partial [Phyllobacteriaceae bacterium]|nr:cellulose biosynthesis cyclic di-GMP-binding regulatory protein BcsB [Phyllobacteriaceae bacterium]
AAAPNDAGAASPLDQATRASDNVAVVTAETGVLRRLPSIGRSTKLTGEIDRLAWPIYLTAAEAAAAPRLRLAHVAAVSVMPEASRLTVFVDGRDVGTFPVATNGNLRVVELTLPAGALHAGWNAVRVEAEQRHRVECSTASTYELWTEIDRARSGLVFPAAFAPERRALADLADLSPDDTGRIRLRLVTGQDPEPARLARMVRLAQAMALAAGWLDPVVQVTRAPTAGPGVDVLIGAQARAAVPSTAGLAPDVVALVDDPDPTRLTLAVPDDAAALDRVIEQFAAVARDPSGSPDGRAARLALGGVAVSGGERHTFAELGAGSSQFAGRLFRTAVDLRLPADFYAADYAKVDLKLSGGYAPGLDRSSRLTIRVNGRQIAGAPLNAHDGETFSDRLVRLPLSAFRPGRNRLEIEASVPAADDKVCDPSLQIDGSKRFLFVDHSEIAFPTFARAARLPDLAATGAGVFSALGEGLRPKIWAPHPDGRTLSAIATLLTRVAVAEGRVDVPEVAYRNPPTDEPSAWVIGAFADLPATVAGAVGLETVAVHDAWTRRPDRVSQTGDDAADPLMRRASVLRLAADAEEFDPIVTGSLQFRPVSSGSGSGADLVADWRRSMESPWSPTAFVRDAGARVSRAFGPLVGLSTPVAPFAPRASTGVVVAQALSPAGGVWTLTTAASAAALADGVETLTEADRWNGLTGDVVAWDKVDEKLETGDGKPRAFFMTAAASPINLRLVAAGWVGDHPLVFAMLLLLSAGLLGFATARLLPHLGPRP